jgi:hypothetical protein
MGGPHKFGNLAPAIPEAKGVMEFWPWVTKNFDPTLTWKDLDWIRENWKGPLVIKGILDAEDARECQALRRGRADRLQPRRPAAGRGAERHPRPARDRRRRRATT